MNALAPVTKRPILPSAGYVDKRPTRHVFVRYEEVPPEKIKYASPGPRSMRPGQALIYRCEETGAERRWGME